MAKQSRNTPVNQDNWYDTTQMNMLNASAAELATANAKAEGKKTPHGLPVVWHSFKATTSVGALENTLKAEASPGVYFTMTHLRRPSNNDIDERNHFVQIMGCGDGEIVFADPKGGLMTRAEHSALSKAFPGAKLKYLDKDGKRVDVHEVLDRTPDGSPTVRISLDNEYNGPLLAPQKANDYENCGPLCARMGEQFTLGHDGKHKTLSEDLGMGGNPAKIRDYQTKLLKAREEAGGALGGGAEQDDKSDLTSAQKFWNALAYSASDKEMAEKGEAASKMSKGNLITNAVAEFLKLIIETAFDAVTPKPAPKPDASKAKASGGEQPTTTPEAAPSTSAAVSSPFTESSRTTQADAAGKKPAAGENLAALQSQQAAVQASRSAAIQQSKGPQR